MSMSYMALPSRSEYFGISPDAEESPPVSEIVLSPSVTLKPTISGVDTVTATTTTTTPPTVVAASISAASILQRRRLRESPDAIGSFILGKVLGRGCTGTVREGRHRRTGFRAAIKVVEKSQVAKLATVRREIAILKLMDHDHVLKLYDVIETATKLYLVLELVEGGELFDYIIKYGSLSTAESLRILSQLVKGMMHCHIFGVAHRDLKPENLLLDVRGNVKLVDFGMAKLMATSPNRLLNTSCGSPHYASPEVIQGWPYDARKSDVWSVGCIFFAMVTGSLPFDHESVPILLNLIVRGNYTIPSSVPHSIAHLISRMLTLDPQKRISFTDIPKHMCFEGTSYFHKRHTSYSLSSSFPAAAAAASTASGCPPTSHDVSSVACKREAAEEKEHEKDPAEAVRAQPLHFPVPFSHPRGFSVSFSKPRVSLGGGHPSSSSSSSCAAAVPPLAAVNVAASSERHSIDDPPCRSPIDESVLHDLASLDIRPYAGLSWYPQASSSSSSPSPSSREDLNSRTSGHTDNATTVPTIASAAAAAVATRGASSSSRADDHVVQNDKDGSWYRLLAKRKQHRLQLLAKLSPASEQRTRRLPMTVAVEPSTHCQGDLRTIVRPSSSSAEEEEEGKKH